MRPRTRVTPASQAKNASDVHEIATRAAGVSAGAAGAPSLPIAWLPPSGGRTIDRVIAGSLPPEGGSPAAGEATGAAILTIGSSHRGSASDKAGTASALRSPRVQTKCRADADARPSAAAP